MTVEGFINYTDSALTDLFKKFFVSFKRNNEYVYVQLIDSIITSNEPIEINYDDFDEILKEVISSETKHRIHKALYRAIKEVLQQKIHSSVDGLVKENLIKFKILNLDGYDEIFDFPKEKDEFEDINLDTICGLGLSVQETVTQIMLYLVKKKKIINRAELISNCDNAIFLNRRDIGKIPVKDLNFVLDSKEIFTAMKDIAYELGFTGTSILLEKKQNTEVAYWVLGRFAIKRIDLTGDVLFFNGQYLENDAEPLIRREARKCLINSTNGDMNEIWHYVEDTADIITHDDIENHAHLKCLLNGTYNINTGEFVEEFSRDNIILQQIPRNYDVTKTYEEIDKLTTQIVSDKIDRQMFYDTISLCLHPYNGVYQQWGGVGIQGSGKGQLEVLVSLTLGKKNCSHTPIHLLATDLTLQKECAYDMCVFDTEVSDENVNHLETIKKWVTQDPFTGRGIYGHKTTFRPSSRLMFTTNKLFELPNNIHADAIYDRTYLAQLNNRYRHTDKEIKNVMKKTATDEELDGFITYLLKNATWIAKYEKTHYPLKPKNTRDIWNIFGNRIANFFKKYFEIGASLHTPKQEVHDKWLHHALENEFGANDKKKFFELFDEIVGTAPMNTRIGLDQVYAYAGFGLKSNEVMKEETQDKLVMTSFKCDSCDVVYNTTEHITRLRAFHREFYPNHLIVEDITK